MKIVELKTYLVGCGGRNWLYVKVCTDEDIEGVGEAYSVGPDEATVAVIQDFERWLVGKNPMDIERLWQMMYNFSRFPGGSVVNSAISGIEQALWDIVGKSCDMPVHNLLGGRCRDKVRVYTHVGGRTVDELVENAVKTVKKGYTSIKMPPQPLGSHLMRRQRLYKEVKARVEAVREAVGDDIDICLDAHAKIFEPAEAAAIGQAVEEYKPLFLEEPLRPENIDALAKLSSHLNVPIATGEQLYTKFQFRELLEKQAADIIQPDICCAGGLLETKKIAAMAEAYYVSVAPHNPMSPVATVANVHLAASLPNFLILEYIPDNRPPRSEVVKEPLQVEDGYIVPPSGAGLGIELNEKAFDKYPPKAWHRNFIFKEDGSVALI